MKCPDVMDLERYVLHELDKPASASIREHLTSCPNCSRDVEELRQNLHVAHALRRDVSTDAALPAATPDHIGPYRVLRKLGQGGMGSVFEAEQENPRRVVAVKIVRPGVVSAPLMARFRREAQVLGRLKHPGIAQIYEAATHQAADGHRVPYFVMELVRGPALIDHANANRLTQRQRLDLIAKICDAVQHAHGQGVIHRDLKPDNILVDESDPLGPQPKILDFGVARVIDPDGDSPNTAATLHTSAGQIVGTVAYMSPEQASADPSEVDTRADVYALGVICYELLSGRLPYKLNQGSIAESVRAILEDDPTPLGTVDRSLRGDVSTIVGKALEKDKTRRYQTAAEMAADVRRYLRDEPIAARHPSTIYQVRKFARRHRGLVGGVIVAVVVLVLGVVGTTIGMVRAQRSAALARREVAKQTAVNEFMREIISAANPRAASATDRAKGRQVTVLEAMNHAAKHVEDGSLKAEPEIEAAVRLSLGVAYEELGEYAAADRHLTAALALARQAYGDDHKDVADTLNSLGVLRQAQGKYPEAEAFLREGLAISRRVFGLRSEAVASVTDNLGLLMQEQGKLAESERLLRDALKLRREMYGPEHVGVAVVMNNLAFCLEKQDKLAEAEQIYRQCLAMRRKLLGEEHPDVATTLNNLAFIVRGEGKLAEAEPMFRQSLALRRKLLGEEHPQVATALNSMGSLLQAMGRSDEALPLYQQALAMQRKLFGEDHPSNAAVLNNIGTLLRDQKKFAEAEPWFRQSLAMRQKLLGDQHPSVGLALANLASALQGQNKLDEAEPLYRQAVAIVTAKLGPDHGDTALYHLKLGQCLTLMGRYDEAEREMLEADRIVRPKLPSGNTTAVNVVSSLADLYRLWGKADRVSAMAALMPATEPATTAPAAIATTRAIGVQPN